MKTVHHVYYHLNYSTEKMTSRRVQPEKEALHFIAAGKDIAIYTGEELVYDYGDPNCPGRHVCICLFLFTHFVSLTHKISSFN